MPNWLFSSVISTDVLPTRQNSTTYTVGDLVYYPYTDSVLLCTSGGTSGTSDTFLIGLYYTGRPTTYTESGSTVAWEAVTGRAAYGWPGCIRSADVLLASKYTYPYGVGNGPISGTSNLQAHGGNKEEILVDSRSDFTYPIDLVTYTVLRSADIADSSYLFGAIWRVFRVVQGRGVLEGFDIRIEGLVVFQNVWLVLRDCIFDTTSGVLSKFSSARLTMHSCTIRVAYVETETYNTVVSGGSLPQVGRHEYNNCTIDIANATKLFNIYAPDSYGNYYIADVRSDALIEFTACTFLPAPGASLIHDNPRWPTVLRLVQCVGLRRDLLPNRYLPPHVAWSIDIIGGEVDGIYDPLFYGKYTAQYTLEKSYTVFRVVGATDGATVPHTLRLETSHYLAPAVYTARVYEVFSPVDTSGYYEVSAHLLIPADMLYTSDNLWIEASSIADSHSDSRSAVSFLSSKDECAANQPFSVSGESWVAPVGYLGVKYTTIIYCAALSSIATSFFCALPDSTVYVCPKIDVVAIP